MFVDENLSSPEEIKSMPGIFRFPVEGLIDKALEYEKIGIRSILLFGVPKVKDAQGSSAFDEEGIVQRAIRELKKKTDLFVLADLCLCEYTDHGHCGLLTDHEIDNDSTLKIYAKIANSYANAGVDAIAPSGMMDGQVKAIREELDSSGYKNTLIMAYSAKFASVMYSPFRDAVFSAPSFGDRKSYQTNYANMREAMREIEEDIEEGADIIMVKPALFYLDLIREARNRFMLPLAAYSVSGEYSMIMAGSAANVVDLNSVIRESTIAIFRAGADLVITYFAEYICKHGLA